MDDLNSRFKETLERLVIFHESNHEDIIIAANHWELKFAEEGKQIDLGKHMLPTSNVGFRHEIEINGKKFHITVDLNISNITPKKRNKNDK